MSLEAAIVASIPRAPFSRAARVPPKARMAAGAAGAPAVRVSILATSPAGAARAPPAGTAENCEHVARGQPRVERRCGESKSRKEEESADSTKSGTDKRRAAKLSHLTLGGLT